MPQGDNRPGLRKARIDPVFRQRSVELWLSSDYRIRQMFEQADVMSEGAPDCDAEQGATYYGTTSIVLPLESKGGFIPDAEHAQVTRMLSSDPHARVRAIRIAWREAQVRSTVALGQMRAELSIRAIDDGVKIDVEVEARQVGAKGRARSLG